MHLFSRPQARPSPPPRFWRFEAGPLCLCPMMEHKHDDDLLALLAWWRQAGVDIALTEPPIDWMGGNEAAPGADFVWPRATANVATPPGPDMPHRPAPAQVPSGTATPRAAAAPPAAPVARAAPSPGTAAPRPFPSTPPDAAVMAAREAARTRADARGPRGNAAQFRRLRPQGDGQEPLLLSRLGAGARSW